MSVVHAVRQPRSSPRAVTRGGIAATAVLTALCTLGLGSSSVGATTTDVTPHWTQSALFPSFEVKSLVAVSCASALDCVAVGQSATKHGLIVYSSDGGTTWHESESTVLDKSGLLVNSVSCVADDATADCVAVVQTGTLGTAKLLYSADGGATWTASTMPTDATRVIWEVSCGSGTVPPTCVAAGYGLYDSVDGGATWSLSPSVPDDGSVRFSSISCANADDCVADGTNVPASTPPSESFLSTNGGSTWSTETSTSDAIEVGDLSCPSALVGAVHCVGAEGDDSYFTTGAGGWAKGRGKWAFGSTKGTFAAVSCAAVQACVALTSTESGAGVLYADDGGDYWTAPTTLGALSQVHTWEDRKVWKPTQGALSCAATICMAVGRSHTGQSLLLTGPSQLPFAYQTAPDATQVHALVQASVKVEVLSEHVVAAVPAAATDDAAHWFGLPRTCSTATMCVTGDVAGSKTLVVYGDSHARMWLPAIDPIATADGYRVVVLGEDGCTVVSMDLSDTRFHLCGEIQAESLAVIAALRPAAVILSDRTTYPDLSSSAWKAGMETTIERLEADGSKVAIIGDIQALSEYPETCLLEHRDDAQQCSQPNPNLAEPGQEAAEHAAAKAEGAHYVDPTPWLCTAHLCSEVIGGEVAYWDSHHVTASYAQMLSGVMASALTPVLG